MIRNPPKMDGYRGGRLTGPYCIIKPPVPFEILHVPLVGSLCSTSVKIVMKSILYDFSQTTTILNLDNVV